MTTTRQTKTPPSTTQHSVVSSVPRWSITPGGSIFRSMSVHASNVFRQSTIHKSVLRRITSRKPSDVSLKIVTEHSFDVLQSRVPRARRGQSYLVELEATQASLDSLEVLFLERMARSSEKKPAKTKKSKKHDLTRAPSLRHILTTVWPHLDTTARAQLFLGVHTTCLMAASTPLFSHFFCLVALRILDAWPTVVRSLQMGWYPRRDCGAHRDHNVRFLLPPAQSSPDVD